MHYLNLYIVRYWILICIAIVMIINSVIKYNEHKKISIYILVITGTILILSILDVVKAYCQDIYSDFWTTAITAFTYAVNPVCLLLFIFLSFELPDVKNSFWIYIPMVINVIVFSLALFPATEHLVFYFEMAPNNTLAWHGGTTILRFTSHIVGAFYLIYLVVRSILSFKRKHIWHAANVILCACMTISAVLIETFDQEGEIKVLYCTIAVCVSIYYLYLYTERANYDSLTGLFSREVYYTDLKNMDKSITGVIQADMNGLKHINDNYGHLEGDNAIKTVAKALVKNATRKMYVYRLGGDEFTILCVNERKADMLAYIDKVRMSLAETSYSCSLGYCHRKEHDEKTVKELFSEADAKMYHDKDKFYQTSTIPRRE
ncbi:MAG: GGDEF domain-containing protein [Acholeplasmatales bacterium]|nr:GGDEF domain-containing protein [Acholeplasmatales bacterium]